METKMILLDEILIDSSINIRDELDEDTIERYMECFDQLPPIIVFNYNGDFNYILADGFHRCKVAHLAYTALFYSFRCISLSELLLVVRWVKLNKCTKSSIGFPEP